MLSPTLDAVVGVLDHQFAIDPARAQPQTRLQSLGLDSLSLMEFVFAIEDHFRIRIPEDRLDPRQAELTLDDLCRAVDEVVLAGPHGVALAA